MSPPLHQPEAGTIAHELAALRAELRLNTAETRDVKHLLTGNGDPSKGLLIRQDRTEQTLAKLVDADKRIDRLEQARTRQDVLSGIALTAGLGAAAATLWAKLMGKA